MQERNRMKLEQILEKIRLPLLSAGLMLAGISCSSTPSRIDDTKPIDYYTYYLKNPPQTNKKYSAPLVDSPIRSNPLATNPPETPATAFLGDLKTFQDYVAKYGWAELDKKVQWYDLMQKMTARIEKDPNDALAYLERAKAEVHLQLIEESKNDCDIALRLKNIEINPSIGSALYCTMYVWDWMHIAETEANHLESAGVKQKFGLYEEAAKAYKKAIAINPNNSEAKKGLEFCLKQTGEPSKEKTSSKDEDM